MTSTYPPRPEFIDCDTLVDVIEHADLRPVVVDVRKAEPFAEGHVPGATRLDYAALVTSRPPVGGLLPGLQQIARTLGDLGIDRQRSVVAYDDEGGGRAGRLLWTLHAIGHIGAQSLLDGGFGAWLGSAHPVETTTRTVGPVSFEPALRADALVDAEYILGNLGREDLVLLDTRTRAEFDGTDKRAKRAGHIPGAVHFNWLDAMDENKRLHPLETLRARFHALGLSEEKEVIAYCQTHHRSSHTFVLLRALGYERAKGYPGAWSEWGNLAHTPVESSV